MGALVGLGAEGADGGLAEKAGVRESGRPASSSLQGPRPPTPKPLSQSSGKPSQTLAQVPSPRLSPLSLSLLVTANWMTLLFPGPQS